MVVRNFGVVAVVVVTAQGARHAGIAASAGGAVGAGVGVAPSAVVANGSGVACVASARVAVGPGSGIPAGAIPNEIWVILWARAPSVGARYRATATTTSVVVAVVVATLLALLLPLATLLRHGRVKEPTLLLRLALRLLLLLALHHGWLEIISTTGTVGLSLRVHEPAADL